MLVGFAGVVIALRPSSSSFTLPALIALAGSVIYALVMITTRMLRQTNDIMLMTTYFLGAVAFGLATSPFGWVTPTAYDVLCLAGVGFANIVAQFCVIRSLKLASASVVVPYQYTLIVWSVVFGWLMFAELPDIYTVAGAAIIVAAGLYIFWRERVTRAACRSRTRP